MGDWAREIESLMKAAGYKATTASTDLLVVHGAGPGGNWDAVCVPNTLEPAPGIHLSIGAAIALYVRGKPPTKVSIVVPDKPVYRAALGATSVNLARELPWLEVRYVKVKERSDSRPPDAPRPSGASRGANQKKPMRSIGSKYSLGGDYEFLETPRPGSVYPLENRRSKRKW